VRLTGSDASSIRGLANYAHRFFNGVDDGDDDNACVTGGGGCSNPSSSSGRAMRNALPGVFRIHDHTFVGYDHDVNGEGRMQFIGTRILTLLSNNNDDKEERGSNDNDNDNVDHHHRTTMRIADEG